MSTDNTRHGRLEFMTRRQESNDAEILWRYMKLDQPPCNADALLVLGSLDVRVAEYAAYLTKQYAYELVVFSGGTAHVNDALRTTWRESEAERFREVFERAGGVSKRTLLEDAAQNTGENARLTYELLNTQHIAVPRSIEIVTKPYMERRVVATFEAQWPEPSTRISVTSPQLSLNNYVNEIQPLQKLLTIMVGDFERIKEYPKQGFQTPQPIPPEVLEAWARLVTKGYTDHLINI